MTNFQAVAFRHGDTDLRGEILVPDAEGRRPAVMVMHTAHGLGDFIRDRLRRLADLGYVALGTDMYGEGLHFDDPQNAGGPFMALQNAPDVLRDRVVGWYDVLKARPEVDPDRVAAIGFCFGGQCVLELARSGADAKAIVSFHGLLMTAKPAEPGAVKGEVAIYHGARDPFVPPAHVAGLEKELVDAGAHWQMTTFNNACHAFTDPHSDKMERAGIGYDAIADRVSWAGTLALLEASLAPR